MPIAASISAVGAIGAAGIGAYSANKAADAQAAQANNALSFQKEVYNKNQGNLAPWINNGTNATYSLASLYGLPTPNNPSGGASGVNSAWDAFKSLPAYTFPFEQGNLALTRQLNAQGRTQSGAQARATQQFGQGLASQYLMSNYVNPLLTMSGTGAAAAGNLAGTNNTSAGLVGNSYGNLGTAQASGIMGTGNALGAGVNNAASSLALYSSLGKGGGSAYGSAGNTTPTGNTFGGYDNLGGNYGYGSYGGISYPSFGASA